MVRRLGRILLLAVLLPACARGAVWAETTFEDFADGALGDGGANVYVHHAGRIETIQRADLDADGYLDLVYQGTDDWTTRNLTVRFFWGGPDGFSDARMTQQPCKTGIDNAIADLDDDGLPDVVVTQWSDGFANHSVPALIYWNDGDRFRNAARTELPMFGATGALVAELNGDGYLDIVLGSYPHEGGEPNTWTNRIFWGGPGGYSTANMMTLDAEGAMTSVAADLNKDGHIDLAVAVRDDWERVDGKQRHNYEVGSLIFWGSPAGISNASRTRLPTKAADDVTAADFDGDGWLDLVFANRRDNAGNENIESYVYYGGPSGFSVSRRTVLPTRQGSGTSAGDLNGDGRLDVVFTTFHFGNPSYIYWNSPAGFDPANRLEVATEAAFGVRLLDWTRDGHLDVAWGPFDFSAPLFTGTGSGIAAAGSLAVDPGHFNTSTDLGHIYDRSFSYDYVSSATDLGPGLTGYERLHWVAATPHGTRVRFQLRTADSLEGLATASWRGPDTLADYYTEPGLPINPVHGAQYFVQYRAVLDTVDGGSGPALEEVRVGFARQDEGHAVLQMR